MKGIGVLAWLAIFVLLLLPFQAGLAQMGVSGWWMYLSGPLAGVLLLLFPPAFVAVAGWGMWAGWGWPWYGVLAVIFAPLLIGLALGGANAVLGLFRRGG
jgi:hypothetical protein